MAGIVGYKYTCPGCGIDHWSPADKVYHACPQFDCQDAEMTRGRKSTRQPPKDGKVRTETLERMRQGPVRPAGVLVECKCPVRHYVARGSVRRKCFICRSWKKQV